MPRSVEEKCANDPSIKYDDTIRSLIARKNRLAGGIDTAAALLSEDVECWNCGQHGHYAKDCRVQTGRGRGRGRGGRDRGRGGRGHGRGHAKPGEGKSPAAKKNRKLREAKAELLELKKAARGAESDSEELGWLAEAELAPATSLATLFAFLPLLLSHMVKMTALTDFLVVMFAATAVTTAATAVMTAVMFAATAVMFAATAVMSAVTAVMPAVTDIWPTNYMTTTAVMSTVTDACVGFMWLVIDVYNEVMIHYRVCTDVFMVILAIWITLKIMERQNSVALSIIYGLVAGCVQYGLPNYWLTACILFVFMVALASCQGGEVEYAYTLGGEASIAFTIDSGATKHVVKSMAGLKNVQKIDGRLRTANGKTIEAHYSGDLDIVVKNDKGEFVTITLRDVWVVPKVSSPLFSVRQYNSTKGNGVSFGQTNYLKSKDIIIPFSKQGQPETYKLAATLPIEEAYSLALAQRPPVAVDNIRLKDGIGIVTWHERLGHMSVKAIKSLCKNKSVKGLKIELQKDEDPKVPCHDCVTANLKTTPRRSKDEIRTEAPNELIWVDNVEGLKVESYGGRKLGYLFVDDYSRAKRFYGLKSKKDFLKALQDYCSQMKSKSHSIKSVVIRGLQSDWATELSSGQTKNWCQEHQIKMTHSAPGSHKEAGVVESSIGVVKRMARAIHRRAGFPQHFWLWSFMAACHILMFMPMQRFGGETSYYRLYGAIPDISHLRTIGCLVYFYNYTINKVNFQTDRGIIGCLLGYCNRSRSYLLWNIDNKTVVRSAEVMFNERVYPLSGQQGPESLSITWGQDNGPVHAVQDADDSEKVEVPELPSNSTTSPKLAIEFPEPEEKVKRGNQNVLVPPKETGENEERASDEGEERVSNWSDARHSNIHASNETQSSKRNRPRTEFFVAGSSNSQAKGPEAQAFMALKVEASCEALAFTLTEEANTVLQDEPESYKKAIASQDASKWREAMEQEMQAMLRLAVFVYVLLRDVPKGAKVIACRWVYKIKDCGRYKARLVIKGFLQTEFGETFCPTMKLITLRLLFALAAIFGWAIRQMDVKNAFLNATLDEPVYMKCPEGYEKEGYAIKLNKALFTRFAAAIIFDPHLLRNRLNSLTTKHKSGLVQIAK